MWVRRKAFAAIAWVCASACTLFYPLDWFSMDASVDASDAGGDGCNGFCACIAPKPVACNDYDEGNGIVGPFQPDTVQGATASIVDAGLSPPAAANFRLATVDASYDVYLDSVGAIDNATIEAHLYLAARPASAQVELLDFFIGATGIVYRITDTYEEILVNCKSPCSGNANAVHLSPALTPQHWTDVSFHITLGSFTGTVLYDDVKVGEFPLGAFTIPPGNARLLMGVVNGSAASLDINFDNVTFDYSVYDGGAD